MYRPDIENLVVIHLTARGKPIGFEIVSTGTLDTILIDMRQIMRGAILANAAGIVLVHNHPSGDPAPSDCDMKSTRDVMRACKTMQIALLDHVVLGTKTETCKGFSSLRELGHMWEWS